jgi:CubicO group peptidase (beta-lactamase class C family)
MQRNPIPRWRSRATCLALCAAMSSSPLMAADDIEARIERVNQGLRPPVSIVGDETWSLADRMRHYGVPGVAITVIDEHGVAWTRVHGLADRESGTPVRTDTLFQAASISKPVAAVGAVRLVQDGKLALDQPVNERLKTWRIPDNEFTEQVPVTLGHLLSHTGGLTVHGFGGYAIGAPVPDIIQMLDGQAPANSSAVRVDVLPGSTWRYSGGGYTVAQLLMTEATGQDFPTLMQERVLAPFGMANSSFVHPLPAEWLPRAAAGVLPDRTDVPGKRQTHPEMAAAGLWTTSQDLALFALEMQRALSGQSDHLTKSSANDMLQARGGDDYGLGFGLTDIDGEDYFGHGGWNDGFSSELMAHQRGGQGVAIMINANQPQFIQELLRAVAFEYQWPGFKQYTPVALSKQAIEAAVGRYRYNGEQVVSVVLDDGRLYMQYAGSKRTELVPIGERRFVRRERETPVTFRLDDDQLQELAFELPKGEYQRHPRLADAELMPRELLLAGDSVASLAAYRRLMEAKDDAASERYLNNEGLGLVRSGRSEPAIKLLELNTRLYPASANTWDSLGYAHLQTGDKERASQLYRKALAIDPEFDSAKAGLEKLGE